MPEQLVRSRSTAMRGVAYLGVLGLVGCHWINPDRCADIPAGAISAPPGSAIEEWACAQAQRAEADDFVIYEADWVAGGTQLGPLAQRRVGAVAERVSCGESPLVLSPSGNEQLDADRRFALQNYLATTGWPGIEDSVRVGWPAALDLLGREAPTATRDLLNPRYLPNSPIGGSDNAFGGGAIANPFGFR